MVQMTRRERNDEEIETTFGCAWSSSVEGCMTLRLCFPIQLKARLFDIYDLISAIVKTTYLFAEMGSTIVVQCLLLLKNSTPALTRRSYKLLDENSEFVAQAENVI